MAVQARKNAQGKVTSHRVRWRLNGARDGAWQTVSFGPTKGHATQARQLDAHLRAIGWAVRDDDPSLDPFKGITARPVTEDDDEPAPTVRVLVAEYAERPKLTENARKSYRAVLAWLGDLADVRADELTARQVNAWVRKMQERNAAHNSWAMRVRVVRGATKAHVDSDVWADVTMPRRATRMSDVTILTDDQINDLIEHATPGTALELPIRVAAETGLRWGEVAGLTPEVIDLERKVIRIERQRVRGAGFKLGDLKTIRSKRTVHISDELAERLALVAELPKGSPVFTAPNGNAWHYQQFRVAFLRVCKLTPSVPDVLHFHDLRHSAAVRMLSRGVPLGVVSKALGHSDVKITDEVYGQFADDGARALILAAGIKA